MGIADLEVCKLVIAAFSLLSSIYFEVYLFLLHFDYYSEKLVKRLSKSNI